MRRLVAALIVASLAFTLVACGGGGEEAATTETTVAAAATPPPPEGTAVVPESEDKSPDEGQAYEPLPTDERIVPAAILERVKAKQPMAIYFYDTAQRTTNDQDAQLEKVMKDNRGLIDLIKYDVGRFASVNASGAVKADPSIAATANAEIAKAVIFAEQIGVSFMPYVVIVDENGYIVWRFRGYTDAKLIDQQVIRVTK